MKGAPASMNRRFQTPWAFCFLLFIYPVAGLAEEAWQITGKAWGALGQKDWEEVERLADHSIRTWGEYARQRNDSLTALPNTEEAKQYPTLNQLATIVWLKGEALRLKGEREEALATYRTLLEDYRFGQTWDTGGWYWSPAAAARDRIDELAPGTLAEITLDTAALPAALRLPGKKGICFSLREPGEEGSWEENLPRVEATRAYWNYSWGSNRVEGQPEAMEFIPMTWGAWGVAGFAEVLAKDVVPQIEAGTAKRLLGFNEPDKSDQANMPYTEALKYWPMLEALGIPLCSPACANPLSDVDDSTQGVRGTWMRDFMREADKREFRIDYIGVHWYGGPSPRAFKRRMIEVYEAYGRRPLLISEFAVADWNAETVEQNIHSPEAVLAFMKDVLPWMEKQNWIAGYAWFSFEHDEAVGSSSTLFDPDGQLTALGRFYKSVRTENPDGDPDIR